MKARILRLAAPAAGMLAAGILLAGCTDDTGDDADGHLLEAQQQALERARQVEDDVAAAAQQRLRQVDEAEGDN